MFDRFSDAARLAMFAARLEVTEAASTEISPEHLLLGLLQAKGGAAARLMHAAGLTADDVRPRLLSRGTMPVATSVEVPFATATKKAMDVAVAEADAMSCTELTTGHLLLGLIRDEHSTVSVLLREAGLALNHLRTSVQAAAAEGAEAKTPDIDELFTERIRKLELL